MRKLLALALVVCPLVASAQTGDALLKKIGANNPIEHPTFAADKALTYKVAWDVTEAGKTPADMVPGLALPANFLLMSDQEGLDRKKVHLAIIVHGTATQSLLNAAAYKAATGVENASTAVYEALNAAGVQIIVCGQALINRKVPRDQILPFVKVSTSATMARATLHAQGYATFQTP